MKFWTFWEINSATILTIQLTDGEKLHPHFMQDNLATNVVNSFVDALDLEHRSLMEDYGLSDHAI